MSFLKRLLPEAVLKFVRPLYHGAVARLAAVYFGHPSDQMVVAGITGTAGKSTTAAMLSAILNYAGKKSGYITTVNFFDGELDYINKHGLSMPGGWLLQKSLRQMLDCGCRCAIVECTSEGLAQNRHAGIDFDMAVFTNLSRAHLEAHGSFGNYRRAKGRLFSALSRGRKKPFAREKMIGANLDDPMAGFFLSFAADRKFGVTFNNLQVSDAGRLFRACQPDAGGEFAVDGVEFKLDIFGGFNYRNAALAAACAGMFGVPLAQAAAALRNFRGVRGRMEQVPNNRRLNILVDYGCEPASFRAAIEAAAQLPHNRLIHVFGSTGGHRDREKRFEFGRASAQFADEIIITNDDVYESDPDEIARNIEEGVRSYKLRKPSYEIILDRREAIRRAFAMARPGDLILISGKGSEQFLVLPGNRRIGWDDVSVVREELEKLAA